MSVNPFDPSHDFGGYAPPPSPGEYGWHTDPGLAPPAFPSRPMPVPPTPPRRSMTLVALVAALIGAAVGALVVGLIGTTHTTTVDSGLSGSNATAPAPKLDGSISAAAAKIGPSVVTINVDTASEQDTGSGVIIRSDGFILTNNHVISSAGGGTGTITVTLKDGRQRPATVVGVDASDDLAVIRVGLSGLTAASFASSDGLVVGQTVVAVGAPLGLSDTVTSGIVSDIGRPVSTGDSSGDNGSVFNAIQTDAAINPGNSGGPLVNLAGDVVGLNAAIATDTGSGGLQVPGQSQAGNIGIGFAIPSDEASRIAAELIATGKATHALMGVTVKDTATGASVAGARIDSVTAGGPAAKAGLQPDDVVTGLDGELIDGQIALVAAVRSHAPGETVTVTYQRGSQERSTRMTLGSAPS
jgi:putative serine protease PepD